MKKKNLNLIMIFFMFVIFLEFGHYTYAANDYGAWWSGATNWYDNGSTNVSVDQGVLSGISNLIEVIGTGVIAIVTVVLGLKYMLGSTQGKAEVKENLMGLVIACTFFFGWAGIRDLLITGNATASGGLSGATTKLVFFQSGDLSDAISQIFTFVLILSKLVCVVVIAYNGMKYILAGADAKAQLKQKTPIMIVGIILIFCTTTFIEFVVKAINQAL